MPLSPRLAAVAALLGPLVVGAWALGPSQPVEKEHSKAWESLHAEVVRGGGDVVLLGNSTSHSDLERVAIARALGVTTVTNPLLPGSGAAGWLAVLEGQIAAMDVHPRLVLVYGSLETILGWRSPPGKVAQTIDELVAAGNTRVARRVFGSGRDSPFARFSARWSGTQSQLVTGLRDRAVGAVFAGGAGDTLAARGAAVAAPALDALFGDAAKLRSGAVTHAIPVVEQATDLSFSTTVPAAESLVPDLVAVAHGLGARVVFIRGPDAPTRRPTPELAAQAEPLRGLIDALGAGYADVSDAGVSPANYHDTIHMNAENRAVLSEAVVDELTRLNPLGAPTMPPSLRPLRLVAARRIGEPPALSLTLAPAGECRWSGGLAEAPIANPALVATGQGSRSPLRVRLGGLEVPITGAPLPEGCALGAQLRAGRLTVSAPPSSTSGDLALVLDPSFPQGAGTPDEAWWVFPGTSLEVDLDLQSAATLRVSFRSFGAAQGSVRVGELEVPLVSRGDLHDGAVEVPGAGPLRIRVSATGGYARLEALVAAREGRSRVLLGGFAERVALRHAWPGDPVPLPTPAPRREGALDLYDLPELAAVSDDVFTDGGLPGCSVLDVRAGGEPLLHRNKAYQEARGARVSFQAGILRVPAAVGPVTLELRDGRGCDPLTWLYPGETRVGRTALLDLASLRSGASELELIAERWGEASGTLELRLGTAKETFLTTEFPLDTLTGEAIRVPLPERRVGLIRNAQLTFTNRSAGFVAVRSAAMVDPTAATP